MPGRDGPRQVTGRNPRTIPASGLRLQHRLLQSGMTTTTPRIPEHAKVNAAQRGNGRECRSLPLHDPRYSAALMSPTAYRQFHPSVRWNSYLRYPLHNAVLCRRRITQPVKGQRPEIPQSVCRANMAHIPPTSLHATFRFSEERRLAHAIDHVRTGPMPSLCDDNLAKRISIMPSALPSLAWPRRCRRRLFRAQPSRRHSFAKRRTQPRFSMKSHSHLDPSC